MRDDRLTATVTILVYTYHRPTVLPFHRLKMYKTTVCTNILEMQEPALSGRSIYPCPLMRTIHFRIALRKHCSPFIRTIYVFRTEHHLPSCRNTTGRMEDIIISVLLIELRALTSFMCFMSIEYYTRLCYSLVSLRIKLTHCYHTLQPCTASGISMYHIYLAVPIP